MSKYRLSSSFSLEGQFLEFLVSKHQQPKGLRLATPEGERTMKLSKLLRSHIHQHLLPGDWIQVLGMRVEQPEKDNVKWKIQALYRLAGPSGQSHPEQIPEQPMAVPVPPPAQKPSTILYCQKSDCMKRGGQAACAALTAALAERGLDHQVTLKGTGCMKKCKAGPNFTVMPDKTRYTRLTPEQVPALIEHHFSPQSPVPGEPPVAAHSRSLAVR